MLEKTAKFIQDWLATPREERNIPAAAEVLLKLNRNRILYGNILGRPQKLHDKLEHELKRQLQLYLDHQTAESVIAMEDTLLPQVKETLDGVPTEEVEDENGEKKVVAHFAGLREDHEDLPDEIKQIYVDNGDVYFKMKALHGQLKAMSHRTPCDRYEYLKQLEDLYKKYRENWNRYDAFDPNHVPAEPQPEDPADLAKKLAAARKYISSNAVKLEQAIADKDEKKINDLTVKIQERIRLILDNKQDFDADYKEKLVGLGLTFE